MARKNKGGGGDGPPGWIVTFSDMMSLLLTFFILLVSMANLDKHKFEQAAGSLQGAFGVMLSSSGSEVAPTRIVDVAPVDDDLVQRLYQRIQSTMHRLRIDKNIKLVKDRGAVILRINEAILFASGESKVRPAAYPILEQVAQLVKPLPLNLRIEGHTDARPIRGRETTNWDLSTQRAVSVLRALAQRSNFPLDRMAAVGYGAERPIAPNDTPENRAKNRRVEFVLESIDGSNKALPYLVDTQQQAPF